MEWFSQVMDLREPVSVNNSGLAAKCFKSDQIVRFSYEWIRAAMEGCHVLMDWLMLGIKSFMSHLQSFVQISKMSVEVCVPL